MKPLKELRITVKLSQDIPDTDEGLNNARLAAIESAVIKLWEAGHLSTREAAKRLELSYVDYIDLLGARGIPVVTELSDDVTTALLQQKLKQ